MAQISDYPVKLVNGGVYKIKIAAGETISESLPLGGSSIIGIRLPLYSYTATGLTLGFLSSVDGNPGTFKLLVDPTNIPIGIEIDQAGDTQIILNPSDFCGIGVLQLQISAAQPDDTVYECVLGPVFGA